MESVRNMPQKLNPYPFYSYMRKNSPLVYNEKVDIWNVYGYNDVKKVLTNFADFSSDFTKLLPKDQVESGNGLFDRTLLSYDPPFHRYLRNTVSSAFSPTMIEKLGPRIKNIANDLIDDAIDRGSIDLVQGFSYPLPVTVIAELLGIPAQDRNLFKRWADDLLRSIDEAIETGDRNRNNNRMISVRNEMAEYFKNVIAEKRQKPGHDLVTQLLQAETDQRKLTEEEILSFCALLLQAGHLTTVNLINNCIWSLLENPVQLAKIYDSISALSKSPLIDLAIEETLRYRSPVQALVRFSTKEIVLGGKTIKSGKRVITWIGSANHDESIFKNPEVFDITRTSNPHIAFGAGIHLCLGAPLARLEGHIALEVLLTRLRNLELGEDPKNLEPIAGSTFLFGIKNLPLKFEVPRN